MADTARSPEGDRKKNYEIKTYIKMKKPVTSLYDLFMSGRLVVSNAGFSQ